MTHPIAYKDCNTPADMVCYRNHKKDLEDALKLANNLILAVYASEQADLHDMAVNIAERLGKELHDYTNDEAEDIQSFLMEHSGGAAND